MVRFWGRGGGGGVGVGGGGWGFFGGFFLVGCFVDVDKGGGREGGRGLEGVRDGGGGGRMG